MSMVKALARVKITIEVHLLQPWGSDATIEQAQRQAKASALEHIAGLSNIAIVGEPKVVLVAFEEDR